MRGSIQYDAINSKWKGKKCGKQRQVLGLSFREFGIGNFSWRAVAGARGGVKSDQNQGQKSANSKFQMAAEMEGNAMFMDCWETASGVGAQE
jgi:hypothetical protein